jgi:S-adenosylmethionine-diacylglycerol 3-amino-3-carboxypropyl transferase
MTRIGTGADSSTIRYAQCWEDADVLLEALDIEPTDTCLAVASAGDNALAMLSRAPQRVIALDLSPAQLACLELRVAAYRELGYEEMLRLMGSSPGGDRASLYKRCRSLLSSETRRFWDGRGQDIEGGIGGAGRFENYFRLFRTRVLPLVHGRGRIEELFEPKSREARERFYTNVWDNRRWRWMLQTFVSRPVLGRLGRDSSFFRYANGNLSVHISERARHAFTVLDPAENPYLQWILLGTHSSSVPCALRRESFQRIRRNIDRLEWRLQSVEDFVRSSDRQRIDRFNLSDIFEYMSPDDYRAALDGIVEAAAPGARLVYWNMLVPRTRPDDLADRITPLSSLAQELHARDKAFFYSAVVVEEVTGR